MCVIQSKEVLIKKLRENQEEFHFPYWFPLNIISEANKQISWFLINASGRQNKEDCGRRREY